MVLYPYIIDLVSANWPDTVEQTIRYCEGKTVIHYVERSYKYSAIVWEINEVWR